MCFGIVTDGQGAGSKDAHIFLRAAISGTVVANSLLPRHDLKSMRLPKFVSIPAPVVWNFQTTGAGIETGPPGIIPAMSRQMTEN